MLKASIAHRTRGLRDGFTLIELMIVISVISILAALTISAAFRVRNAMRVRAARGDAARLGQALNSYMAHTNFLPMHLLYDPENDGDGDYENYEIVKQVNGIKNRPKMFVYKKKDAKINQEGSFVDAWGRAFRVVTWYSEGEDPLFHRHFRIYSCGENQKWEFGYGDDVSPGDS
jgi:prepilin-type N-terminal cleavage/methylation domain-containing protein